MNCATFYRESFFSLIVINDEIGKFVKFHEWGITPVLMQHSLHLAKVGLFSLQQQHIVELQFLWLIAEDYCR